MNKICNRCKIEYEPSYFTDKNRIYKICRICRDKNPFALYDKEVNKFIQIEKTLYDLNYTICHFTKNIFQNVKNSRYDHNLIHILMDNNKVMFIPKTRIILVPSPNTILILTAEDYEEINFLKPIKKIDNCEICFESKNKFMSCSRCNKSFCSECFVRSKLNSCMFCRYNLEEHIKTNRSINRLKIIKIDENTTHMQMI